MEKTLYIKNLNEDRKKDETKRILNMIFSQYGKVAKITVCKGLKLRGQVCFGEFCLVLHCAKNCLYCLSRLGLRLRTLPAPVEHSAENKVSIFLGSQW